MNAQPQKKSNPIHEKSFRFALRIVNLARFLREKNEYGISKQLLRSGTAIGALVREAQQAESRKDFVHKLMIALKEADETGYWLELLVASKIIEPKGFQSIHQDLTELLRLLTAIIKRVKESQNPGATIPQSTTNT
jgi:four helix bundle protein